MLFCLCFCVFLQISDSLQESYTTSVLWQFLSLGYALMLCPFVIVLGGMFFLATALFFLDDRDKAEKEWVPRPLLTILIELIQSNLLSHYSENYLKALRCFRSMGSLLYIPKRGYHFPFPPLTMTIRRIPVAMVILVALAIFVCLVNSLRWIVNLRGWARSRCILKQRHSAEVICLLENGTLRGLQMTFSRSRAFHIQIINHYRRYFKINVFQ